MIKIKDNIERLIFYLFIIIVFGVFLTSKIPNEYLLFYAPFGILYQQILDGIVIFIAFLISIKADFLYLKTKNPQMAIIAGGFLAGTLLVIQGELSRAELIPVLFEGLTPQFHLLFGKLLWSASLFIAVFYTSKTKIKNPRVFIYFGFMFFAVFITMFDRLFSYYFLDYTYKIIPNIPLLNITIQVLYLLSAYIYTDIRVANNKNILTKFNLGLFWLGIVPIFVLPSYGTTLYAILDPFIKLIGFSLIFLGLKQTFYKHDYLNFRQKLTIYLLIFLLISYIFLVPIASILIDKNLPLLSSYFFYSFFIIVILLQYILANKFIQPVKNIISGMEEYSPTKKPNPIPIVYSDEIGFLTQKINNVLLLNWEYTQELLTKQKKLLNFADKEKLTRKLIESTRSSLNIDELLQTICVELSTLFDVERVTITEFIKEDEFNIKETRLRYEFKTDESIKSFKFNNNETQNSYYIAYLWAKEILLKGHSLLISNIEISNMPQEFKDFYKDIEVKSIIGVPIMGEDNIWGMLVLSKIKDFKRWTNEDKELIETIAKQAYIAIKQAELFLKTKNLAEKEYLLREITSKMRSTLNSNEIKQTLVNIIGEYFKADLVFFAEYNSLSNSLLNIDKYSEYRSSENIKSYIGESWNKNEINYLWEELKKEKQIYFSSLADFIKENHLEKNNYFTKLQEVYHIKSGIKALVTYQDEIIGLFFIDFINEFKEIKQDDFEFLSTLTNQTGIAIYQSRLYESVKLNAKKERFIKEIITEIKVSQNIDYIYSYVLLKLGSFYNVDRAVFIQKPLSKYEPPIIKYEYRKNEEVSSFLHIGLHQSCLSMAKTMLSFKEPVQITKRSELYQSDENIKSVFDDFGINSIIATPLIKLKEGMITYGSIILCSEEELNFSEEDVYLLDSVSSAVVSVIWEINKNKEIDEMRNTFMLTLAHDLQVPLVGENKAIEFLLKQPDNQNIGKYKDFLNEIKENNQDIYDLLTRLLNIYDYESGKHELKFQKYDIRKLINNTLINLSEIAEYKDIKINIEIKEDLSKIKIDGTEIQKALYILIENAITYNNYGGNVWIRVSRQNENLLVCIKDDGVGIPPDLKDKIFERYAMALATQRKIGSGLALYLTKQIIEAHNGKIWFNSEQGLGSTFCFSLPISE